MRDDEYTPRSVFRKLAYKVGWGVVDHAQYHRDYALFEPYCVTMGDLKKMNKTCDELGLTYYIDGRSEWGNGTLHIKVIKEKHD
jgi:hypothetical protein